MNKYKSHKVVEAGKITEIAFRGEQGDYMIALLGGETVVVSHEYISKHRPLQGGWYVRYGDGYESFSPDKAFVEGYTLVEENDGAQVQDQGQDPQSG